MSLSARRPEVGRRKGETLQLKPIWVGVFGSLLLFLSISTSVSASNFPLFSEDLVSLFDDSGQAARKDCRSEDWESESSVLGKVLRVVDGDTVHVLIDKKRYSIRMLSIDTPETNYNGKSQGYWAEEATRRLKRYLPRRTWVEIEFDWEVCDQHGRMLGHIWKKATNVNRLMVESALAVNYCIWPNEMHCQEYGRIAEARRKAKKGVYGDKDFVIPYEWRRLQRKQKRSKYVGDIITHNVYRPDRMNDIKLGWRIFFFSKEDIQDPYRYRDRERFRD